MPHIRLFFYHVPFPLKGRGQHNAIKLQVQLRLQLRLQGMTVHESYLVRALIGQHKITEQAYTDWTRV